MTIYSDNTFNGMSYSVDRPDFGLSVGLLKYRENLVSLSMNIMSSICLSHLKAPGDTPLG